SRTGGGGDQTRLGVLGRGELQRHAFVEVRARVAGRVGGERVREVLVAGGLDGAVRETDRRAHAPPPVDALPGGLGGRRAQLGEPLVAQRRRRCLGRQQRRGPGLVPAQK